MIQQMTTYWCRYLGYVETGTVLTNKSLSCFADYTVYNYIHEKVGQFHYQVIL